MLVSSWLLLVFIISNNYAGQIICGEPGGTDECGAIINCPNDNSDCEIICAKKGCQFKTINCLDGYVCTIRTGGDESAAKSIINGNSATKLDIFTGITGQKQIQEANVTCPSGIDAHCFVDCKVCLQFMIG